MTELALPKQDICCVEQRYRHNLRIMGPHGTDLPGAYQQLLSTLVRMNPSAAILCPISNFGTYSYQTQYTVLKTNKSVDALPNLTPEPQQQVYWYHDLVVSPFAVISDIPCDSKKTAKRGLPFVG